MSGAPRLQDSCSVGCALEVLGDRWTLFILRNAFHGMRRFDDFQTHLGISSSVLSGRLRRLTDAGVLVRVPSERDGRSFEYRLSKAGLDLYPVFVALMQWGDRWRPDERGQRSELFDKARGEPIGGAHVLSSDGRSLRAWEVEVRAGPAASASLRELIGGRDRWRSE